MVFTVCDGLCVESLKGLKGSEFLGRLGIERGDVQGPNMVPYPAWEFVFKIFVYIKPKRILKT